ncbi:MAG TPA: TonB-dependent receptor [Woeseiaceae bacterium]|nr:TonB-dependent receptor [Woeseiaceae bacterium]
MAAEEQSSVRVFPVEFFADAQAQTAYDMISLLPGFTFDAGDKNVRGYSGSTGNVLIDGQRPVSKFDDLANVLQRIPAATVARVDLIRGTATGIDMQGRLLVANIVRRNEAAMDTSAELGLYAHGEGHWLPEGRLEASRRWGEQLVEGSVHAYQLADDDSGDGFRQRTDTAGNVTDHARSSLFAADEGMQAALGYERPLLDGKLRLNTVLLSEQKKEDEDLRFDIPMTDSVAIREIKSHDEIELGAHFDRPLGGDSTLNVLLIQQIRQQDKTETEITDGANAAFTENSESGETIARATIRNSLSGGLVLEWGAELAYNFLDSNFISEEDGSPVFVPNASVHVEENRAEGFTNVSWVSGPRLSSEVGIAFEFSRISQESDDTTRKSLSYLKPRAALTWTPTDVDQFRFRLQRNVGQLDFDDFVSSAELSTSTLNIGNTDLEPYTAWDLTANWERLFWRGAILVLGLRHAWMDKVVDIIPVYADTDGDGVDEVYDGPGNLGKGSLDEFNLGLDLPLDGIGISGGTLKGNVAYVRSSVRDPLTNERRPMADTQQAWQGEMEFTQDLPAHRLRWGVNLKLAESKPEYRLDETRVECEDFWVGMFVNYYLTDAWTVSLRLENLSARKQHLARTLYDAPRDTGNVDAYEARSMEFSPYVYLQVRWQRH